MAENNVNTAQQNVQSEANYNDLVRVRREKLAALQDEGNNPFIITKYSVTHHGEEIKENFESLEGKEVSVAGRMMSKRIMSNVEFIIISYT